MLTSFDGLDLKLSIGDMTLEHNSFVLNRNGISGRVRLESFPAPINQGHQMLSLEDIDTGKGIASERRSTDVLNELRFVLRRDAHQPILVRC